MVRAKDKAGNLGEAQMSYAFSFLVDYVSVGDYVALDVGEWDLEQVDTSTWGGAVAGVNKAISVPSYSNENQSATSGWRVLTKSGSGVDGVVTLITAGCPGRMFETTSISDTNTIIKKYYATTPLIAKARSVTREEIEKIDIGNDLRTNASYYWITNGNSKNYVRPNGEIRSAWGGSLGVRPVVVLVPGVQTNIDNKIEFLGQKSWIAK